MEFLDIDIGYICQCVNIIHSLGEGTLRDCLLVLEKYEYKSTGKPHLKITSVIQASYNLIYTSVEKNYSH